MITELNCVDCEIHVIKLEVNLTNFTCSWGGIFSTLPSLVFLFEKMNWNTPVHRKESPSLVEC